MMKDIHFPFKKRITLKNGGGERQEKKILKILHQSDGYKFDPKSIEKFFTYFHILYRFACGMYVQCGGFLIIFFSLKAAIKKIVTKSQFSSFILNHKVNLFQEKMFFFFLPLL